MEVNTDDYDNWRGKILRKGADVRTPKLDVALGLHQDVSVIYQVSGEVQADDMYLARLWDETKGELAHAEGSTVGEALARLEDAL